MTAARKFGVVSFGEALVDFLPDRRGLLRDCKTFAVHSGGAPSNVAVGLARLGIPTAFCGVLGDDEFGKWLQLQLSREGIDARLRFSKDAPTGIWFIALDEQGNRSFFTPTGTGSADKLIGSADVARAPIADSRWLHTGTSAHVRPEARDCLVEALERARRAGTRTCCDPNLRIHLWKEPGELRALCDRVFPLCDLVKISEDETELCTGIKDPEQAARRLAKLGVKLACITLAERGVLALRGEDLIHVPAPKVNVVDTTGAGDGFVAGLLSKLAHADAVPLESLSVAELTAALKFGCAIGSRVCTQIGAVAALPKAGDVSGD